MYGGGEVTNSLGLPQLVRCGVLACHAGRECRGGRAGLWLVTVDVTTDSTLKYCVFSLGYVARADSDCHVDQCCGAIGFCLTKFLGAFEYSTDPCHSQSRKIGFVYVLDAARRNGKSGAV
ncbi:hypothetical protein D3C80_1587100 [compost metagenome]